MKQANSRKIIKFAILLFFYVAFFMGMSDSGSAEIVDRIVAQVNEDIITLQDLEKALIPFEEKIREGGFPSEREQQLLYKAREDVLDKLIGDKLTEQEAKDEGITIKAEDIDRAIEHLKSTNFFTQEQLLEALANDGMTLESLRQNIREQMLRTATRQFEGKIQNCCYKRGYKRIL